MITEATIILCFLATSLAVSPAAELVVDSEVKSPTEVSIDHYIYNNAAIIFAGTVLTAGAIALTVFFFPVMAYRICYALGGCQNTMDSYVDQLIGKELGQARNIRSRNKRSMEYIEPILVTLAKAYEEYGDEDVKKNFKRPSYYGK